MNLWTSVELFTEEERKNWTKKDHIDENHHYISPLGIYSNH